MEDNRSPRRALDGATAQQTKAPQRPERYEADGVLENGSVTVSERGTGREMRHGLFSATTFQA